VVPVDRNPEWTTTRTAKDTRMLPDPRSNMYEANRRIASAHADAHAGRLARSHRGDAAGPSILRVAFRRLGRLTGQQPSTTPARVRA